MKTHIAYRSKKYIADLNYPLDISISLRADSTNVNAWYLGPPTIEPVKMDGWIGDVKQGGSVNFRNIFFNPHAHGTHTECVGHIAEEWVSVNQHIKSFFSIALVISVSPDRENVITKNQIELLLGDNNPEALVIRTLPNSDEKCSKQYSNTEPPYIHHEAATYIREKGILHLLIDLPSVDAEKDDGKLLAHRAFWNYPEKTRFNATITEFIYVNDTILDGLYLLNLMFAPFENDASPSKPVLYKLVEEN